ncbi:hypothetical protein [Pectobacterium phage vB_ParM-25]|nr:hypothetical protein [Serratia phage BUCT660]URG14176.1 hypothetical protein [Pectobacterium phage vB_ParM-25]
MNNTHLVITVTNGMNSLTDTLRVELDNFPVARIKGWVKSISERYGLATLPTLYYMDWGKVVDDINENPHTVLNVGGDSSITWEAGNTWPKGVNSDGTLSAGRNIKFHPTTWSEIMFATHDNFLEVEGFILVDKTGAVYEYGILKERNFINLGGFDFLSSDYKAFAYHRREGVVTLIERHSPPTA